MASLLVGLGALVIIARLLAKLVGASSESPFVGLIDAVSSPVVTPFKGMFANGGTSTNTIETASLVGLVVFVAVGWLLVVLIRRIPAPQGLIPKTSSQGEEADGKRRLTPSSYLRVMPVLTKVILGAVLLVIAARGVGLALGASPESGIVNAIYNVSDPLVAPFQFIFPDAGSSTHVIEFATVLAILVYSIVGVGCLQLFRILKTPRGTRPATISESPRSPFDVAVIVLVALVWVAGAFVVIDHYTPVTGGHTAVGSPAVASPAAGGQDIGGNAGSTTAPPAASSNCVPSNDGSNLGWDFHKRVNATSFSPCYSHWTVHQAGGRGCQSYINFSGPYAAPSNIWNIVRWGYDHYGNTAVYLYDGTILTFNCVINEGGYPQTTLHSPDWN